MAKLKRTAQYYATHPEAKRRKAAYDKEHNQKPEQRKKRSELVKINREKGTYGNGDGKDFDHAKGKMVDASTNRGRGNDGTKGDKKARGKKVKRKARK